MSASQDPPIVVLHVDDEPDLTALVSTVLTDRLAQLLENLLRNAIEHGSTDERDTPSRDDALEHGKPATDSTSDPDAATIRVTRTPAGFAVEENGPGIPAPDRERIFEHEVHHPRGWHGIRAEYLTDIVQAQGWTITEDEGPLDGARFTISTT